MKILLTGKNRSGKTTILRDLIADESSKQGFITLEVRDTFDRIGFDTLDSTNRKSMLARTGVPTNHRAGRYYVDVDVLDAFIEPLFKYDQKELLFIDEIGQMQLYSNKFQQLATHYLGAKNDFIGTFSAIYPHPFIESLKHRNDALICYATPENRAELEAAIRAALHNRAIFNDLPPTKRNTVLRLAQGYLFDQNFTSFKKLFNNAIHYVQDGAVAQDENGFLVSGKHAQHAVLMPENNQYTCDCDLFNGRGTYAGRAGECSHIQAVKITSNLQ